MGSTRQSPRWPPAADAERRERPGRGLQVALTRSTIAAGGPLRSRSSRRSRSLARALRDAADRAVRVVGDPAGRARGPSPRAGRSSGSRRPGRGRVTVASRRTSGPASALGHRAAVRRPRGGAARRAPGRRGRAPGDTFAASSSAAPRRAVEEGVERPAGRAAAAIARGLVEQAGSRTDRAPPRPTRARSRATSVHRPSRTSAARRRSAAGVRGAGPAPRRPRRRRRRRRVGRAVPARRPGRRRLAAAAPRGATVARRGGRVGHRAASAAARRDGARRPPPGPPPGGPPAARRVRSSRTRRQLVADQDRLGRRARRPARARPAAGEPAEAGRERRVGQAVVGEDGLDVARARRARGGAGRSASGPSAGGGSSASAQRMTSRRPAAPRAS